MFHSVLRDNDPFLGKKSPSKTQNPHCSRSILLWPISLLQRTTTKGRKLFDLTVRIYSKCSGNFTQNKQCNSYKSHHSSWLTTHIQYTLKTLVPGHTVSYGLNIIEFCYNNTARLFRFTPEAKYKLHRTVVFHCVDTASHGPGCVFELCIEVKTSCKAWKLLQAKFSRQIVLSLKCSNILNIKNINQICTDFLAFTFQHLI